MPPRRYEAAGGTDTRTQKGAGVANDTAQYDPEPFEMVPHWLLMDTTVSATALRIWLVLRKHRNYQTGDCWPGRKRLSELCGVSVKTVDRELPRLAAVGAITITKRRTDNGDSDTNLYRVHWEPFGAIHRGGVNLTPPRDRKNPRGGVKKSPELIPIDNKDVPLSILTMDDGPEHDAAYLAFLQGRRQA